MLECIHGDLKGQTYRRPPSPPPPLWALVRVIQVRAEVETLGITRKPVGSVLKAKGSTPILSSIFFFFLFYFIYFLSYNIICFFFISIFFLQHFLRVLKISSLALSFKTLQKAFFFFFLLHNNFYMIFFFFCFSLGIISIAGGNGFHWQRWQNSWRSTGGNGHCWERGSCVEANMATTVKITNQCSTSRWHYSCE